MWLYVMEQVLEYYKTNMEQRLRFAAMYLNGSLLQWYRWLLRSSKGVLPSWVEFEKGIILKYGRLSVVEHSGELSKLKQEGADYDRYQEEFINLSSQIQELPKDYLVGCFISGLRDQVKYELISKKPTTVMEAMRLAQVEEEKLAALKKS